VSQSPVERTGVLVIRAWVEYNGEPRLRARIMRALDTRRPDESTVAATTEEITAAVVEWLDELLRG
jgi:hypothetical protein